MVKNRKIIAFTGMRSEYDLQFSVAKHLTLIEHVDFSFVVFGAHLSERFGYTINDIYKDGFKIISKSLTSFDSQSHYAKAKAAGILMTSIADIFENNRPDLIIVAGDREETIIAATVATYFNIPIAHLFGGDKTFPESIGDVDEPIRHATTKLAHIHFPIHKLHAKRIEMMGEEPWRIHCEGSPALDKFLIYSSIPFNKVEEFFKIPISKNDYAVIIYHSLPNNIEESCMELENILSVLLEKKIKIFISYPNNDPGNFLIIKLLEEYSKSYGNISLYKNLSRDIFIPLIKNSSFLIGNSSMGILECPFMELPAINVGKRQQERLNAGNVVFCDSSKKSISAAIDTVSQDQDFLSNIKTSKYFYGDGFTGKKIADILSTIEINDTLLAKQITY
jgi:GDP/UDP-N,N'-diacetylbacillosamine 2-epimerase (hydrolysing)